MFKPRTLIDSFAAIDVTTHLIIGLAAGSGCRALRQTAPSDQPLSVLRLSAECGAGRAGRRRA
jgi:hypothetical protein